MFSLVINFFYGWYVDDTRNFWNWFANYLKMLDRSVGLIGNLQNWASPLYGDYTIAGVIIGPVLRTLRILFGIAFYLLMAIFSLAVYLFWIILPIGVIAMIILNLLALLRSPEQVISLADKFLSFFI